MTKYRSGRQRRQQYHWGHHHRARGSEQRPGGRPGRPGETHAGPGAEQETGRTVLRRLRRPLHQNHTLRGQVRQG